jgi:hypothetical protein
MNPLIQLHRQLQYLFIPLLLTGFVIPAMGADPTPNHKELTLNKTPANERWREVSCVGVAEGVDIRGKLKLRFGMKDGFFRVVDGDLATGWSGACPKNGNCLVGFGKITNRRYTANTQVGTGVGEVKNKRINDERTGLCTIKLYITSSPNPPGQADPCPGCRPANFRLVYEVTYKFNDNHRVIGNPTFLPPFGKIECAQ